jgi:cholest-4-en-3-one 26-monooxygenase
MKLEDVDIYNPDTHMNGVPHAQYELLRREDPVHFQPEPNGARGFWVITKYEDLAYVSTHPELFSSYAGGGTIIEDYEGQDLAIARTLMINMDPPSHGKFRKLVSRGFTPRMTAYLEPRIKAVAKRLVDGVGSKGHCDFVTELAVPLPLEMIAELIGVPPEDRGRLLNWTNRLLGYADPELGSREDMPVAAMEMMQYSFQLAATRKGKGTGEDLATILCNASVDGEALNDMEFAMFVLLLSVAGNETTRNLLSNGMVLLMEHPEIREQLRKDFSLIPNAIEEMLRLVSPITYMRRTATQDVVMRGKTIKAGDKLAIAYASANRDEDLFPNPHVFDIQRANAREHVAFGIGQHFCMGSNLARLEIRVLLEEILTRIPDMQKNGAYRRLRSSYLNGVKELQVKFTPEKRASAA